MFELSELKSVLGCIEFVAEFRDGELINPKGDYDTSVIDKTKLSRYLRQFTGGALWIDFNEIAVNPDEFKVQLDLLGIVNEPILLIGSSSEDISYYWFIKFVNYEINKELYYGPDQKLLIEKLVNLWLSNNVKPPERPETDLSSFLELSVNQSFVISQLKQNIETARQEVVSVYNFMLKQVLLSSGKEFPLIKFSKDAINFINQNKIYGIQLNELLIKASSTLLTMFPHSTTLILDDYLLGINYQPENSNISTIVTTEIELFKPKQFQSIEKVTSTIENTGIKRNSTDSTLRLLDRYEIAVSNLLDKNEPVLGKTIASACNPPISAPGLTDSINKHKDRIFNLMQEFPEKWTLLRSNYAPIAKILNTDLG